MSSIRPSALVLDDEDDWGTFSPVASAMSRQPSSSLSRSSVASGEYNMFAGVGSGIAGGGGSSMSCGFLGRMFPSYALEK